MYNKHNFQDIMNIISNIIWSNQFLVGGRVLFEHLAHVLDLFAVVGASPVTWGAASAVGYGLGRGRGLLKCYWAN